MFKIKLIIVETLEWMLTTVKRDHGFKPKVVLVPKSSNSPSSKNWLLHSSNLTDIQHHEVRGKVTFKFSVGSLQKGDFKTTVISAPHPSYTPRIGREFRESAQNAIFTVLQNC